MISSIRSSQSQQVFIKFLFGAIALSMVVGPVFSIFQNTSQASSVFASSKKHDLSFQDFFALDPVQGQNLLSLATEGREAFSKILSEYLYARSYQDFLKDHRCEMSDDLAFSLFVETYLPQYFPTQEQRNLVVQQIFQKYPSHKDFLEAHRIREQLVATEFQKIFMEFSKSLSTKLISPVHTVYGLETAYFKVPSAHFSSNPSSADLEAFYQAHLDSYQTEPYIDLSVLRISVPQQDLDQYFEGLQTPWTQLFVDLQQGAFFSYEELLAKHQDLLQVHEANRSEHYTDLTPESLKALYDHQGLFEQCLDLDFSQSTTALTAVLDGGVLSILEVQNPRPSTLLSFEQAQPKVLSDYKKDQSFKTVYQHAESWAKNLPSDFSPEKIVQTDLSLGTVPTSHPLWMLFAKALDTSPESLPVVGDYLLDQKSSADQGVIVHRLKAITLGQHDSIEPDHQRFSAHVIESLVGLSLKDSIEKDYGYTLNNEAWKALEPLIQKAQDLYDDSLETPGTSAS